MLYSVDLSTRSRRRGFPKERVEAVEKANREFLQRACHGAASAQYSDG